jgi:hypothetical protein
MYHLAKDGCLCIREEVGRRENWGEMREKGIKLWGCFCMESSWNS